jgi:hypothetical protein
MNDTIKQIIGKATLSIELATASCGVPEPTVRVALPKGTPYRYIKVTLHALAAKLELATHAAGEHWCIYIASYGDFTGTIVIELGQGTPAEAARAMALLQQVASAE